MLRKLFVKLHGEGEAHQMDFFRCHACHRLITWNMIRGGRACCGGRVVPTNPSLFETVKLFVVPWTF